VPPKPAPSVHVAVPSTATHFGELKMFPDDGGPLADCTTSTTENARMVSPKSSLLLRMVYVHVYGP
jgi:hypothetical protein